MKFVAYYRLSKKKTNGEVQYGIEVQKETVAKYLATQLDAELIGSFEEIESGAMNNRPELLKAFELCKKHNATLILSRLDRLSRNAAFLLSLRDSNITFVCCDFPSMDRLTCGILALVAEKERENISARVKAGLAIARRTKKLGCPVPKVAWSKAMVSIRANKESFALKSIQSINEIKSTGVNSLNRIAQYMNKRGETTRLGGKWTATAVKRVIDACKL